MSFLVGSVDGLNEEEVPVIDVGGIEPVIEINEEVETHLLETLEEDFDAEDEEGFFEETEKKIRKEVMETIEKSAPQMQQPVYQPMPIVIPSPPVVMPPQYGYQQQPRERRRQPQPPVERRRQPQPQQEYPLQDFQPAPLPQQAFQQQPMYSPPPQYFQPPPQQQQQGPPPPFKERRKQPPRPIPDEKNIEEENVPEENIDGLLEKFEGIEEPEGLSFLGLKKDPEYVNADISNLLEYLEGLTDFLVDARKNKYTKSIMKLKVETLKLRFRGHKGLLNTLSGSEDDSVEKIAARVASGVRETGGQILTNNDIENTFSYIKDLAGFLPEKSGGEAVNRKLQHLLEKIEAETDGDTDGQQ